MARVTIEDCLEQVPNRFELIQLASNRAKQLNEMGYTPLVDESKNRNAVIALREIAAGHHQSKFSDQTPDEWFD